MRNYWLFGLLALSAVIIFWLAYEFVQNKKELVDSRIESVYLAFEIERAYNAGLLNDGDLSRRARSSSRRMAYEYMLYFALNNVRDHNAVAVTSNFVKVDNSYAKSPKEIRHAIDTYLQLNE